MKNADFYLQPGNPDGIVLMVGTDSDWVPPDHSLQNQTIQVYNINASQMRNGSIVFAPGSDFH